MTPNLYKTLPHKVWSDPIPAQGLFLFEMLSGADSQPWTEIIRHQKQKHKSKTETEDTY